MPYYFLRLLFFFLCALPAKVFCLVLPLDKSTINYTHVYFEEELVTGVSNYELVYYDSLSPLPGKERKAVKGKLPAFWISDLAWGKTYCWRVKAYTKEGKLVSAGDLHSFSIFRLYSNNVEETRVQVKVNKSLKHAQGLIFVDHAKTAYDRSGKAVWTIPDNDTAWDAKAQIRDLKMTGDHTFSFLAANVPVEMDYNGTVLWKAPQPFIYKGDTIIYHHEFRKTKRGTYMVMGIRPVYRKITGAFTTDQIKRENAVLKKSGDSVYKKAMMTILFEFDKNGNVIWDWDSNTYFTDADMNYKKGPAGMPLFGTHANAFSENEEGTKIYVGFRDISRIIKLDKKSKQVELTYGERFPSGDGRFASNAFRKQHDASVTTHNSILVFNNDEKTATRSSVLELKDNLTTKDSAVLWKFNVDFDPSLSGKSLSGGNVVELPNSNLLVCAGVLNRIFEVTRLKEVVWNAVILARSKTDTSWQASAQYRCNWTADIKRFYFISQLTGVTKDAVKGTSVSFVINNTGNADDMYQVELRDRNGNLVKELQTNTVKKNGVTKQTVNYTPGDTDPENFTLVIKSLKSGLKKELTKK